MVVTDCQDQMKYFTARFRGENKRNISGGIIIYQSNKLNCDIAPYIILNKSKQVQVLDIDASMK